MNPKIKKLKAERAKNCAKIADLTSRNEEIDGLVLELENLDIVGMVRAENITPEMLMEILRHIKETPLPAPVPETTEETEEGHGD